MGFAAYQLHELSRQERRYDNLHTHTGAHTHTHTRVHTHTAHSLKLRVYVECLATPPYIKPRPKDFCRIVRELFELWEVVFERGEHQLQN